MKKSLLRVVFSVLVLTLLIFFLQDRTGSVTAQSAMSIVYFDDYAPFSWVENGQMKGIFIDILNAVLRDKLGIAITHTGYPWARAQKMVQDGLADAFVTVPTPERREYTIVSEEPAVIPTFTIFTGKTNPLIGELQKVKELSELKKYKLVHYLGSGWAAQKLKDMNVTWVPTLEICLTMIAEGKADVFIDSSPVIRYSIKKAGLQDKILEIPTVLDSSSFNLCIGKKSTFQWVMKQFDAAIKTMKNAGVIQKILDSYR